MKALKIAGLALGAILLSGCAPKVSPLGTLHASRADGTVTLGYKVRGMGGLESFTPSFAEGHVKAAKACTIWGYTTAVELDNDLFNFQCQHSDPYMGCQMATFSKVYQCAGDEPGKVSK